MSNNQKHQVITLKAHRAVPFPRHETLAILINQKTVLAALPHDVDISLLQIPDMEVLATKFEVKYKYHYRGELHLDCIEAVEWTKNDYVSEIRSFMNDHTCEQLGIESLETFLRIREQDKFPGSVVRYKRRITWTKNMCSHANLESLKAALLPNMERELHKFIMLLNWAYNPRLPKPWQKIAVIGAGVGSLGTIYHLLKLGFTPQQFTILERDSRVGGKCCTIKSRKEFFPDANCASSSLVPPTDPKLAGFPIVHDMGAIYIGSSSKTLRSIMHEVQSLVSQKAQHAVNSDTADSQYWEALAREDITRTVATGDYVFESSVWTKSLEWNEYFTLYTGFSVGNNLGYLLAWIKILLAKIRFCHLQRKLVGNYSYLIPPKPALGCEKELMMPFLDFLKIHKLDILIPIFSTLLTAQGFGYLDTTSTFSAMHFFKPDRFDGYVDWPMYTKAYRKNDYDWSDLSKVPDELKPFYFPGMSVTIHGMQTIYDRLVQAYSLDVKFNAVVQDIVRKDSKVAVKFQHNDQTVNAEFDFLILGAPITDAYEDPTKIIIPIDLDKVEHEVLASPNMEASVFRSFVLSPNYIGKNEAFYLRVFPGALQPGLESSRFLGDGSVIAIRDSWKNANPLLTFKPGCTLDSRRNQLREKNVFQLAQGPRKISDNDFQRKWTEFAATEHHGLETVIDGAKLGESNQQLLGEVSGAIKWTYNTRFTGEGLIKGKLWQILELQGRNSSLFVHGSNSIDTQEDILLYSKMVIHGLSSRSQTLLSDGSDGRVLEWQRPVNRVINKFSYFCGLLVIMDIFAYVFRSTVNRIMIMLAAYDCRRDLYKSRWAQESLPASNPERKTFADIKEYIQEVQEKGDHVFHWAKGNSALFRKYCIGVHMDVKSSLEWNFADFRSAYAFWLDEGSDLERMKIMPINITIVYGLSYALPGFYEWMVSWILASHIRIWAGFSYRFEDRKGGGLFIPECKVIKKSAMELGISNAQQICAKFCKIPMEERLRRQGVDIEMIPTFVQGNDWSCCIKFQSPAKSVFSDHALVQLDFEVDSL